MRTRNIQINSLMNCRVLSSIASVNISWAIPKKKSMFQEDNLLLDMDLHGTTWKGLSELTYKNGQVFTQVKEKLSLTYVTLLRFL